MGKETAENMPIMKRKRLKRDNSETKLLKLRRNNTNGKDRSGKDSSEKERTEKGQF